jgi:cytochrome c553
MRFTKTMVAALCVLGGVSGSFAMGAEDPPAWAYPVNPPDLKPPVDDGVPRRVPDSSVSYAPSQLTNMRLFVGPDWHPQDHPAMPEIVAKGRAPNVFACAFCHRADGAGSPDNASLAGLPVAYILLQMSDYKSGARSTSVPKREPQADMIALSKSMTESEVLAAAAYFSSLKHKSNVRVVETATAPRTFVTNSILAAMTTGEKEPIGQRIVEVPENLEQFENRDSRAQFIAYAPLGSVAKGEGLVLSGGGGKTLQCASCHGRDLKGTGVVPPIAGRSPSYIVRQLYDFQSGARAGMAGQPMKEAVARLTVDDMVAISAYLASVKP